MKRRIIWGIIVLAVMAVVFVYFVFDPSAESWFPKCRMYQLTGYKCPGCGSQRMLHALLHGDVVGAIHYNAYLFVVMFYCLAIAISQLIYHRYPKFSDVLLSVPVALTFLVLTLLWWVLRNVYGW